MMPPPRRCSLECEIFLAFERITPQLARTQLLLQPIAKRLDSAILKRVTLHYQEELDALAIELCVDRDRMPADLTMEMLRAVAAAGGTVIETDRLKAEDCRRFRAAVLPLYGLRVTGIRTIEGALSVLAQHLRVPLMTNAKGEHFEQRIEVRFRRGDSWQLGRPRSLSIDGIYVATGCPPRCGDVVEIEVACSPARFLTHAAVLHVTLPETAAELGAAGFGARFLKSGPREEENLRHLLTIAREAVPTLAPPPRRRELRYPLCWPVTVGRDNTQTTTTALDISAHGMFIAGMVPANRPVEITIEPDEPDAGDQPLRARARVVRAVPLTLARSRGIPSGTGLEITGVAAEDSDRFERFVERVAQRAMRTVVIGAAPRRASELHAELAAAGYAVGSATDPPSLVARAAATAKAPDLVVLDSSLDQGDLRAARAVSRALSARRIPTLAVDAQKCLAVRRLADSMLIC
ncbi:MAG: PilZ domain-containing protein [Pseudomonadota bacterium]